MRTDDLNFLHFDMNSYFATLLQQENPSLRGRPIGVVKSEGRTCLIATSKEAKKLGVTTGCNIYDARKLIPDIITVPAAFDLYFHCTIKLKALFESLTPDVEIFSLDEAFVPIQNCKLMYPDPMKLALNVQDRVKEKLGEWVTCNVGISYNRFLAKMAGEIAPKGTIFVITQENKDEILKTVTFKDVCGIGTRLAARLEPFGVTHPYEINALSDEVLEKYFGPFWSKELRRMGRGEGSPVLGREENDHMKNVGRTITGWKLCNNEEEIRRVLYNLMEEVTFKVRKMDLAGRYVSMFLEGHNKSWHTHKTLKHHIRHTNEMFDLLYNQGYKKWCRNFSVIKFGVGLGMLTPASRIQLPLFSDWYRQERLYKAMDKISEKFGLFTVRSGILKDKELIRPEVTGYLGDKKYQFSK